MTTLDEALAELDRRYEDDCRRIEADLRSTGATEDDLNEALRFVRAQHAETRDAVIAGAAQFWAETR